jgi:hypothetical protein
VSVAETVFEIKEASVAKLNPKNACKASTAKKMQSMRWRSLSGCTQTAINVAQAKAQLLKGFS